MIFSYILAVSLVSVPLGGLAAPLDARHEHRFGGPKSFDAVVSGQTAVPSGAQGAAPHPLEQSLHAMEKSLTLAVAQHNETAAAAFWSQKALFQVMESARRIEHGGNATHPVNVTHASLSLLEGVHKATKTYSTAMVKVGGVQSLFAKLPTQFATHLQAITNAPNLTDATMQFLGGHQIAIASFGIPQSYLNGLGNSTFGHLSHEGPSLGSNATQTALFLATPPHAVIQGHSLFH